MATLRVVVQGAMGRMGQEVLRTLAQQPDMEVVGAVDVKPSRTPLALGNGASVAVTDDLDATLASARPHVVVDFTNLEGGLACARAAVRHGVHAVIGSSGFTEAHLAELEALTRERDVGVLVVPNFAIGAVVLEYLARLAAPFFEYVEIVEAHHETKVDAPSGTALALARAIATGGRVFKHNSPQKESLPGTRGGQYQGVAIHAMRMPGKLAQHEVVFGTSGQTLSLRHDTINRECYMPGVLRAIRAVVQSKGLTVGLDKVLGLG